MAITTLNALVAGMKAPFPILKVGVAPESSSLLHSEAYASGMPGAMAVPSPGLAGAALTSYAGQIPFVNPPGGQNAYIAQATFAATVACGIWIFDRLWHNSGITITTTTGQTINSVAFPARDLNGSTNGEGVMVGLEFSTQTGNAGAITNTTLTYTNQAGTGSRTATISSVPATTEDGTFMPFQLQAGDTGVRSIQTLTLGTSYVSGVVHLVAYRPLLFIPCPIANVPTSVGAVGAGMVRCFDNTVPWIVRLTTTNGSTVTHGQIVFTHG